MTILETIRGKWNGAPKTLKAAEKLCKAGSCIICNSRLLVAFRRYHDSPWIAHCNHCASQVPLAVMLNREAWKITAKITFNDRECRSIKRERRNRSVVPAEGNRSGAPRALKT